MQTADYDYFLPERLIAQDYCTPRDSSRLMVIDRGSDTLRQKRFFQLSDELRSGDVLVLNDTKVLPARLFAKKESGTRIELLLLKRINSDFWEALVRPGSKVKHGCVLFFDKPDIYAEVFYHEQEDMRAEGVRTVKFMYQGDFNARLEELGQIPLPPYIKKPLDDKSRYQTVYAKHIGSAAAPTAGLHFTPSLLKSLRERGIVICSITLHVGIGTFRPIKTAYIEDHTMHAEHYSISADTAAILNSAKADNRRIIAVGTTTVRALESAVNTAYSDSINVPFFARQSSTDIFIYPGYQFKAIDGLITNFHLPKSSLLLMVSAFAGKEKIMSAYQKAIMEEYRFYSFGDAMLIV